MSKKTILVVCTNSDLAGAPIHVLTLVTLLKSEFHFVVVFGEEGPVGDKLRQIGIEVHVVPQMRSQLSPIKDLIAYSKVFRIALQVRPDLIHCHSAKAGMIGRLVAITFMRIPTVYTVHGWAWRGTGIIKKWLTLTTERLLYKFTRRSHYIYVSSAVEREALAALQIKPHHGSVILNGVPDYGFTETRKDNPMTILMPARVSPAKDHETLIKAFEMSRVNAELWLCGHGTDHQEFQDAAKIWAPTKFGHIQFLGIRADVPVLLKKATVFALISNYEALPLSIIEAMCVGRAVVATDVGGVNELIQHGVTGFLADVQSIDAVAEAFDSLSNAKTRERLTIAARNQYENQYEATKMASSVAEVYQSMTRK